MRSKTGRSLKKFLSLLLTLSMVLGMLPTFAMAATVDMPTIRPEGGAVFLNVSYEGTPCPSGLNVEETVNVPFTFILDADELVVSRTQTITPTINGIAQSPMVVENLNSYYNYVNAAWELSYGTINPTASVANTSQIVWNQTYTMGPGVNTISIFHQNAGKEELKTATITIPASGITVTYGGNGADGGTIPADSTGYTTGGTVMVKTDVPTRTGYDFAGWLYNGNIYAGNDLIVLTDVYNHITLTAQWTLKNYTVNYIDTTGDTTVAGLPASGTVTHGNLYTVSSDVPTRDKYTFAGWKLAENTYVGGQQFTATDNGTSEINLVAQWEFTGPTITSLTTAPAAEVGKTITATAISDTAEGYVSFSYDGVTKVAPVVPAYPTGGIATVDFAVTTAGTIPLTALQYGTTLPVKESLPVQTDVVSVAAGMASKHTVTFYDDSDENDIPNPVKIVKVDSGDYIEAPTTSLPTKDGMVITGWTVWTDGGTAGTIETGEVDTSALFNFGTTAISGETKLVPVWETAPVNSFDVTFNMNDGTTAVYEKQKVAKNDYAKRPVAPERAGYIFGGWYTDAGCTDGNEFDFNTEIDTTTDLYAKWTAEPTYYDVVFNPGCDALVGNMPADDKVEKDQPYTIPVQAPIRTDYEFKGWDSDGDDTTIEYAWDADNKVFVTTATPAVTADVTLTAVWAPVQVNVKYLAANTTGIDGIAAFTVTNGGSTLAVGDTGNSVDKNSTVTIQVTLTEGYDPATLEVLAGDKPLYGLLSGGKYIYEFTAEKDTEIKISESLAKKQFTITLPQGDGYATEFAGCTPNDADGKSSHTFNYGDKFKVKLTVQPDIKATLKIDGTTAATLNAGATVQTVTSDVEVTVTTEHNVSVAIEKKIIRTVTYSLEPHSGLYTTQLVENNTAATKPANPEIRGYSFDGKWYTNPDYTAEWNFADAVTADMILYGKLTAKTNTISYNENKPVAATGTVSGMPTSTTKTYGQSVQLDAAKPTLEGYDFMGWATSAAGPVAYQPGETFITELDANITLYAVWQIKTYTVTMPAGTGYSVTPSGVNTVDWNSDFTFTVVVDRQYAATEPVVKVNGTTTLVKTSGAVSNDSAASWTYTIEDITENKTVEISVTKNAVHTVKFYVSKNGTAETDPFLTQSVEHGYYATMPAAPAVEGYVFKNVFYTTAGGTEKFPFETIVTTDDEVYAYYEAITPQVVLPADGTGWTITFDGVANVAGSQTGDYAYGADAKFVITVQPGYDMTNIKVSVNDNLWAYTNKTVAADGTITLEYFINNLSAEEYLVRVTDIERKTVTVTYNANALDDVSGMPEQQVVKYYLTSDYDSITTQEPVRTGYTFLGWSTNSKATTATYSNPVRTDGSTPITTDVADFTTDTTLYAIWKAVGVAASVKVTDATVAATSSTPAEEFEGETVTLKAKVGYTDGSETKGVSTGKVLFYRVLSVDGSGNPQTAALIGSVDANGTTEYTLEVATSEFKKLGQVDQYYVKYSAEGAEGFADSNPSDVVSVKVMSKALKWASNNEITFKVGDSDYTGDLVAGNTYILVLPKVTAVFAEKVAGTAIEPKAGIDYEVTWYVKSATNDWTVVTDSKDDTLTWTDYKAGQMFRAEVNAIGATFAKELDYAKVTDSEDDDAAKPKIDSDGIHSFDTLLYTKATDATVVQPTTTTIAISDVLTGNKQYEQKTIAITATVVDGNEKAAKTGLVTFCVVSKVGTVYSATEIAQVAVNENGVAETTYALPEYVIGGENIEYFYAVYTDAAGTYQTSNTLKNKDLEKNLDVSVEYDPAEIVKVLSTTITWELAAGAVVADGDKLIVYKGTEIVDANKVASGIMEANNVYTLVIPDVYDVNGEKLTVGTDYVVEWIYKDDKGVETKYTKDVNGDSAVISAEYSKYQFRAVVTPVKDATRSVYNKAAGYNSGVLADDDAPALYTQWTEAVAREMTVTGLTIEGADLENQSTVIDGTTVDFGADHWAQFEGDKLVLKAAVTIEGETAPVSAGYVDFYRYNTDDTWTKLNADPVAVDENTGIATFGDDYNEAVLVKAYVDGTGSNADEAKANVDKFFAVYLANATWETSASTGVTYTSAGVIDTVTPPAGDDVVYVKSTTIKTPVIDVKRGTASKGNTTYTTDLDNAGLTAGVDYTLTLRETGASTSVASDWSVVALDGRTVAAENYSIQWWTGNGSSDPAKVDLTEGTDAVYTAKAPVKDDYFYVELTAQNDMDKGEKSNKVIIDAKQNVTVVVTATPDKQYQLNDVVLTAVVKAAETDATMKPTGNVTFYYSVDDGAKWVEIDTDALDEDAVTGDMVATITTKDLPVKDGTFTMQDVDVTAVYEGDTSFNCSKNGTYDSINDEWAVTATDTDDVTEEVVTVYSSVVFVSENDENKAVSGTLTEDGIHIVANGEMKANETDVALTLQTVYTLDHADKTVSTLEANKDYTIQWQILENASQYNASGYYGGTEKWNDIVGATGTSYTIGTVAQDAAYRVKITVTDEVKVQGSWTGLDQGDQGDKKTWDGRKEYYSNVLIVGAGMATVTTNITTSANKNFNEEGIVEGETVTIHALVAGAANVTPISKMTATILPQGETDPAKAIFTAEEDTVDGYNAFVWDTTNVTPGYYTLTVKAESNNGYAPQTITRTLIVRDKNYTLTVTDDSKVYNGKAQGIDWTLTGIDIENALAQKSVVVYYYQDGKLVEPTQAGEYSYELILPASAYWIETVGDKIVKGTFTIEQRPVSVVDLVAQAKVYDGTTNINELEIVLNDSAVNGNGVATDDAGIINGDSIYATGVMSINAAGAGERTLSVADVALFGDDAANYKISGTGYTETINVQRSQVQGDIADATYKYTGKDIQIDKATEIYLIDQAGKRLDDSAIEVTYYYHNGDGVEKVAAMNKLGMYTVIARPEQTNYKGGASQKVYVVSGDGNGKKAEQNVSSALINITNTVELYGAAGNKGIVATADGATTVKVEYNVVGAWTETAPENAGRYLVKVTATTAKQDDVAYGLYTVVKANPILTLAAEEMVYDSDRYDGTVTLTGTPTGAEVYYTYTGGTIQGVAYEAPTEAGSYVVTAHIGETDNYTAHEVSANFAITKKALTITAQDLQRWQYGAMPDMIAEYKGLASNGVAVDTSLRDVQVQPEFIFNEKNGGYTNSALDQVGVDYTITVRNALARNYEVTYKEGNFAVTENEPKAELAIHGMIDNANLNTNIAYYGDQIQLYAYGFYKGNGDGTGVYNTSSLIAWSLSSGAPATIDEDGLLTITGVGTFTVTLTRGSGSSAISTSIEITAKAKEVTLNVEDANKVYKAKQQYHGKPATVDGEVLSTTATPVVVTHTNTRIDVGSQVTEYYVDETYYISEVYGGLFTINDKEVTINAVNEPGVVYGAQLKETDLDYTESGTVGTPVVDALTDGYAVSIRNAYVNLDVTSDVTKGYEILVAGRENINYNVKYVTEATDNDVEVVAKTLKLETGVINSDGRTSGYMKDNGQYFEANGFEAADSTFTNAPVDRMYGEVNPAMAYLFTGLITGDDEADLDELLAWLVEYDYNINADANVKFVNSHLNGHRVDPTVDASYISNDADDVYVIETDLDADDVVNYNTNNIVEATQNIFQRPVSLALKDSQTELDVYIEDAKNDTILLNIIKQNLEVSGYIYNGTEYGGLAEKLGHTMEDLQLTIIHKTVDLSGDYIVHVKVGNPNYWLSNTASGNCGNPDPCTHTAETFEVKIHVTPDSIKVVYTEPNALGWTSASVVMHKMPEDQPVNLSADSKVYFAIYEDKGEGYDYSGETKIRSGWMTRASQTGVWTCTYSRLTAGNYRIFAIPVGDYTIINSGNVPVPAYPNP